MLLKIYTTFRKVSVNAGFFFIVLEGISFMNRQDTMSLCNTQRINGLWCPLCLGGSMFFLCVLCASVVNRS